MKIKKKKERWKGKGSRVRPTRRSTTALGRNGDRTERNTEPTEPKITKILKWPKNHEDGSDFNNFWMKSIVSTICLSKNFRTSEILPNRPNRSIRPADRPNGGSENLSWGEGKQIPLNILAFLTFYSQHFADFLQLWCNIHQCWWICFRSFSNLYDKDQNIIEDFQISWDFATNIFEFSENGLQEVRKKLENKWEVRKNPL